eukprot:2185523-Prymnesium_polylepis.1
MVGRALSSEESTCTGYVPATRASSATGGPTRSRCFRKKPLWNQDFGFSISSHFSCGFRSRGLSETVFITV